jgi:UrcA family protein
MTMNIVKTSTARRGLIAGATFVALSLGIGSVATAAGSQDARQIAVSYADLDVSTTQGASVLYGRIQAAAEGLCENYVMSDYSSAMRRQACIGKVVEGAVNQVAKPALFAVYNARKGTPRPLIVVASEAR